MRHNRVLVPLTCEECGERTLSSIRRFLEPGKTELILLHVAERPHEAAALHREEQASREDRRRSESAAPLMGADPETFAEGVPGREIPEKGISPARITESKRQKMAAEYRELLEELRGEGYDASVRIWLGRSPAQAIGEAAEAEEAELIAMATHGRSGLARALSGSVAESVVRRSKIPVLLARLD